MFGDDDYELHVQAHGIFGGETKASLGARLRARKPYGTNYDTCLSCYG